MLKKVFFAFLVFLLCASQAHATWYFGLTLRDVRAQNADGQVSFRTLEPLNNPANCANTDYYGVRPDRGPELALTVLLTAYTTGKKIDIYVYDSECDMWGRPSVKSVRIRD